MTSTLLPQVSRMILSSMAEGTRPTSIQVNIGNGGSFEYAANGAMVKSAIPD